MLTHARWNIWETNSSSVHNVVINSSGPIIETIPESITITTYSYGWERRTYRSLEDKLSYLVSCINCAFPYDEDFADNANTNEAIETLEYMLHEIGIKEITYKVGDDMYPKGYVENADAYYNSFFDYIISSRDINELKDYLFNQWSYVETGNDNDY